MIISANDECKEACVRQTLCWNEWRGSDFTETSDVGGGSEGSLGHFEDGSQGQECNSEV